MGLSHLGDLFRTALFLLNGSPPPYRYTSDPLMAMHQSWAAVDSFAAIGAIIEATDDLVSANKANKANKARAIKLTKRAGQEASTVRRGVDDEEDDGYRPSSMSSMSRASSRGSSQCGLRRLDGSSLGWGTASDDGGDDDDDDSSPSRVKGLDPIEEGDLLAETAAHAAIAIGTDTRDQIQRRAY